jgi:hypothetical protein
VEVIRVSKDYAHALRATSEAQTFLLLILIVLLIFRINRRGKTRA